jgi:hypothetical protein
MVMTMKILVGAAVGGGLGFVWYKFVGCSTGNCPLTSNPFISTLYGAALGALIAGIVH